MNAPISTMVVKSGEIIYNIPLIICKVVSGMFNFNNKKTKQTVSAIIILILVIAMIVPTLVYLIS